MGRYLYLMRHAKSSWKEPFPDRERPLNKRGKRAARTVGEALARRGIEFDRVYTSDARRARSTAKRLLRAMGASRERLQKDPRLYRGGGEEIVEFVHTLNDSDKRVLIVGHNPALSDALFLLGAADNRDWLPTGAIVGLHFDSEHWKEILPGTGDMVLKLLPRSLEEK